MKFSIIPDTKSIDAAVKAQAEYLRDKTINTLQKIGAESVAIARELPDTGKTYHNHSGRLRDSIGYMVFYNGTPVAEDFKSTEGRNAAMKLRNKHANGYALVMVAGAEYAMNVHVRGYDVLDSAIIYAQKQFSSWLSKQ